MGNPVMKMVSDGLPRVWILQKGGVSNMMVWSDINETTPSRLIIIRIMRLSFRLQSVDCLQKLLPFYDSLSLTE